MKMKVGGDFVGVEIGAEVVGDRQLKRVAWIELKRRAGEGGGVARAIGIELVGHRGDQLARRVVGRGAGVEFFGSIQNRIAVGAGTHQPDIRLQDAVPTGDDRGLLKRLQLFEFVIDFGNEVARGQQILRRKNRALFEILDAQ